MIDGRLLSKVVPVTIVEGNLRIPAAVRLFLFTNYYYYDPGSASPGTTCRDLSVLQVADTKTTIMHGLFACSFLSEVLIS